MNYVLNLEKIRAFAFKGEISLIEREIAEEGLRQIAYGTGPIAVEIVGSPTQYKITNAMEQFLIEQGLISKN